MHADSDSRTVMIETLIALGPAFLWMIYRYGGRTAILCLFSVLFATLLDLFYEGILLLARRQRSIRFDGSAPLMGLLIAFTMPASVSLWVILLTVFAAVILLKRLLCSIVAPVAASCAIAMLITHNYQSSYALSGSEPIRTALDDLIAGSSPDMSTLDLFLGLGEGGMGQISGILLILGGLYLLIRGHIRWEIPAAALVAGGFLAMELAPDSVAYYAYVGDQIFSGGMILGVIFIAADPIKMPISVSGRLIYGALIGAGTILLRVKCGFDGIYLSIAILSLFVPLIDRLTLPAPFGGSPRHDRALPKKD